jgi:hypothetical protein
MVFEIVCIIIKRNYVRSVYIIIIIFNGIWCLVYSEITKLHRSLWYLESIRIMD